MIFIVRARFNASGQLQGMVTHPGTGRRERFTDVARIGQLIATMSAHPEAAPGALDSQEQRATHPSGDTP